MQLSGQKVGSHLLMAINNKNNRYTTPPQTHIAFIVACPKGIGHCNKSGTGKNQGRQQKIPHDDRCYNCKGSHSNSNELSSPVIYVSPPWNNSVINPTQLFSVGQQSSSSSQNTPHDNSCFNIKDSNSNSNEFSSLVIPVTPPLNDLVVNPPHMSLVCPQSFISSHNTMHEL